VKCYLSVSLFNPKGLFDYLLLHVSENIKFKKKKKTLKIVAIDGSSSNPD
jgi:hypothetical protein